VTRSPLSAADCITIENELGAHNYHPLDVVISRAEGIWVWDMEGKKYLDFLAAYSAVNQGHCHPRIREAATAQMEQVTLTSRAFRNDQLPLLYRKLHDMTGMEVSLPMNSRKLHDMTGMEVSLPMNSGAEAVETAFKAARKWGEKVKGIEAGKQEIIVCSDNFHGRTISIISASSEPQYREGFGPFTPGFVMTDYGDIEALEAAITPDTCAFVVEPIQGEAGIRIPPDGYLEAAGNLCREHNVLLIFDEIQSGLGRCGKLFAYQYEQVEPDGLIVGKALSGGYYPVSAFLAGKEVMDVFTPGDHGSTFGGNPLGCAIAVAALEVIEEEQLAERSAELGAWFLEQLRTIDNAHIVEIRGRGLFIGLELDQPARPYCEAMQEEGLLCKETHENVIRFAPPLVIGKDDLEWAFGKINGVLTP